MAYISTENVAAIREELKQLFPRKLNWIISVRRENYSSVDIVIKQAPIELREDPSRKYEPINHYFIENRQNKVASELLQIMYEISNKNNYDRSDAQSDYFDVGFYFSMSIGSWDKPFTIKHTNGKN
jgi:hypothetical protein